MKWNILNAYYIPTSHLQSYNLPTYQLIYLGILLTYPSTHPPAYLSVLHIYLLTYPPTYLPAYILIMYLPTHPPRCIIYLLDYLPTHPTTMSYNTPTWLINILQPT